MNSNHDSGTETGTEHSPSHFTAVNGRDSMVPGANHIVPHANHSNEQRGGQQHHQWERGSQDASNQPDERFGERGDPGAHTVEAKAPSRSSSQGGLGNKHKRKRSDSREPRESLQIAEGMRAPRSPVDHDGAELHVPSHPNGATPPGPGADTDPSSTSAAPSQRMGAVESSRSPAANSPWPEYDYPLINQAQRAQQMDTSDTLQHDAQDPESTQRCSGANYPAQDSTAAAPPTQSAAYPLDRPATAVQVAPKRKRVFSNRTKTGCMTCRRRKKKCDEQHPQCNNCIRGGFLCEGYSSRSTWQKPSSSKTPVPLQSKEGFPEFGGQYIPESAQHHDRQLTEHIEPGKMRPIVVDDPDRPAQQYNTSPTGAASNPGPWSKRGWPGTGHAGYLSEHLGKADYRDVPPIHELPREGHPRSDYPVVPPIRELSRGPHPKSNLPLFQPGVEQRQFPSAAIDTNSPQAQARMALSIENQLSARTVSADETEKKKMIRGEMYRPFDVQLVEDRDRCKSALWRFNNAYPLFGISPPEQNRLLKEILIPPSSSVVNSPSGVAAPRSAGSLGQGVVVEPPFSCHYGYNIHLAHEVMVSEHCLFFDDCPIRIGARTWIGPKVSIFTSMARPNLQERNGPQSLYQGRQVVIEEDCYIGMGCTILPGVQIGRGAYVAPGEVVKENVREWGNQGMKPDWM